MKKRKLKIIFTADDFGIDRQTNLAILNGFERGLLTSTCILSNGEDFLSAIKIVLSRLKQNGIGVHLNIIEGRTVQENIRFKRTMLYDHRGNFSNSFFGLLIKSWNKNFLKQVETEFRMQIERVLKYGVKIDHLNSHVHVHSIPNIFKIVCKLAKEYNIEYVRTQEERLYLIPNLKKIFTFKFYINLIKHFLLNVFTKLNKKTLKEFGLKTNDYFVGVEFTGYMDEMTIKNGIKSLRRENGVVEVIVHPTMDKKKKSNYKEYKAICSRKLYSKLKKYGIFINFKELSKKNT